MPFGQEPLNVQIRGEDLRIHHALQSKDTRERRLGAYPGISASLGEGEQSGFEEGR